jgi:nicotinamide-nucleotide amidase
MTLFPPDLLAEAEALLAAHRAAGTRIATAESCTGGLVAGLLTEIPGSSDVVERGFVTYANEAKMELLGVSLDVLETFGAVSEAVAYAMAQGALMRSRADVAVSITGVAGPGGGSALKPVGLVAFGLARRTGTAISVTTELQQFADTGRTGIRIQAVRGALALLRPAGSGVGRP